MWSADAQPGRLCAARAVAPHDRAGHRVGAGVRRDRRQVDRLAEGHDRARSRCGDPDRRRHVAHRHADRRRGGLVDPVVGGQGELGVTAGRARQGRRERAGRGDGAAAAGHRPGGRGRRRAADRDAAALVEHQRGAGVHHRARVVVGDDARGHLQQQHRTTRARHERLTVAERETEDLLGQGLGAGVAHDGHHGLALRRGRAERQAAAPPPARPRRSPPCRARPPRARPGSRPQAGPRPAACTPPAWCRCRPRRPRATRPRAAPGRRRSA